jgi:hypothetical protein
VPERRHGKREYGRLNDNLKRVDSPKDFVRLVAELQIEPA